MQVLETACYNERMTNTNVQIPLQEIESFCRKWKVREFSLFGSVLREDFRPESDVDVLVSFLPDATYDYWYGWPEMLDELTAMFGREVDLVDREALRNPFRRYEILTTRQVLYAA